MPEIHVVPDIETVKDDRGDVVFYKFSLYVGSNGISWLLHSCLLVAHDCKANFETLFLWYRK